MVLRRGRIGLLRWHRCGKWQKLPILPTATSGLCDLDGQTLHARRVSRALRRRRGLLCRSDFASGRSEERQITSHFGKFFYLSHY